MPEPLESGDEMLIKEGYFTVQNHSGLGKRPDYPGEFTKSPRVIPTVPAEEMDLPISLDSQDSPPIVFLLVHPSLPMEGAGGESGVHQRDLGVEGHAFSISG